MTEVEYTHDFGIWWHRLKEAEQESVAYVVGLLESKGPTLHHPHSSGVAGSKHAHMRELRIQHQGRPYRVFYAFDPRRKAILLLAGDKTGDDRFYLKMVPKVDRLYDEHLDQIRRNRNGSKSVDQK